MLKRPAFLFLSLVLTVTLHARTWTDKTSKRTLEGDFVKFDGTSVFIQSGKQTHKIDIQRLSDADKRFIETRAKTAAPEVTPRNLSPLGQKITLPISVKGLPVIGSGDSRKSGLEVTNSSDKEIAKISLKVLLFGEDGELKKTVGQISDGDFGGSGKTLPAGKSFVTELSSLWIKDSIKSVSAQIREVSWADGTRWPSWEGPAPKQEGDSSLSLVMKGIVGEGDAGLPLIGCYNHSDRVVKSFDTMVRCLDESGKELSTKTWGNSQVIEPNEGAAFVGYKAFPAGTAKVELSLKEVTYADSPRCAAHSALTAKQVGDRNDVSGGNWKVSFEEEQYLGFVFLDTLPGKEPILTFHWSAKPSLNHDFHFSHHETKPGEHDVIFSSGTETKVTRQFAEPEGNNREKIVSKDVKFSTAGRRIGKSVLGPISLYSLESNKRGVELYLRVVCTKDIATAEASLKQYYAPK